MKVDLTRQQVDVLIEHENGVRLAVEKAASATRGVLSALDGIPQGAVLLEMSTDPPHATLSYPDEVEE